MMSPDFPRDETARLEALRELNLLDTLPEERFDRITRLAQHLFEVPMALISLVDAERQWFKSCIGVPVRQTPRSISFCAHAILGESPLLVADTLLDPRFHDNPLVISAPRVRFYAGVPLRVTNGSRVGTLCVLDHRPRSFANGRIGLLCDLACIAERELCAAQLATVDELTGLNNRRGFEALARQAMNLGARSKLPMSLLYFDLDRFKQINDRYGHAEGDRALASFARLLKSALRGSDVVGRIGGDEFVALLNGADAAHASAFVDRLSAAVAEHNRSAAPYGGLGFSVGVVQTDAEPGKSLGELMQRADAEMYKRKRQQRFAANARKIARLARVQPAPE